MAPSPPRRARRWTTLGVAAAVVAASVGVLVLRTEPGEADYLTPDDAQRALTRVRVVSGSDQVVGVVLDQAEATVRVLKSGRVHSWVVRPGREAVEAGSMAATGVTPVRARDLDLRALVAKVRADEVATSCRPNALKAEVGATDFPGAVTHVWCLDGARHAWLGPKGEPLGDVDPRTAGGLAAAVADLRRFTGARQVSHLAIRFGGEDAGVDLEVPGACGDLAACDALVASRRLHVDSRDAALRSRQAPARLNYAAMVDLDTIDMARIHATIERMTQTRRGVDWWRNLTVTLSQRPGHRPTLEFKQGSTVFWTDLDGADATF